MPMNQSDTVNLMRIIGLPSARTQVFQNLSEDALVSLLPLAIKNKVPLLFLEHALNIYRDSKPLKELYEAYLKKSHSGLSLIKEISESLIKSQTNYVVFKTLKPFPFITVDVDIIFFTRKDLMRAYHELQSKGCNLAGYGAHSITVYSPKHAMNVDLHLEVSVSRMVYVNKQLLEEYVTEVNVNSCRVPVLETPVALAMVLAHSLYKEQMFTLADYYTTIIHVLNTTRWQRKTLVDFAEQAHIGLSIKAALMIVNALTAMAFGRMVSAITEIAQMIQTSEIEEKTMQLSVSHFARNATLPHKYHPMTVVAAFAMKALRDPVMRGTLTHQFVELITDTSKFLESVLLRMRRETC